MCHHRYILSPTKHRGCHNLSEAIQGNDNRLGQLRGSGRDLKGSELRARWRLYIVLFSGSRGVRRGESNIVEESCPAWFLGDEDVRSDISEK